MHPQILNFEAHYSFFFPSAVAPGAAESLTSDVEGMSLDSAPAAMTDAPVGTVSTPEVASAASALTRAEGWHEVALYIMYMYQCHWSVCVFVCVHACVRACVRVCVWLWLVWCVYVPCVCVFVNV